MLVLVLVLVLVLMPRSHPCPVGLLGGRGLYAAGISQAPSTGESKRITAVARGRRQYYWMHAGLYGYFVANGAPRSQAIPHCMYYQDLMRNRSTSRFAGWWV